MFERAAQNHQQGNLAAAERDYKATVAAEPSNFWAHHNLGALYAQEERWPEAEAALQRALEIDRQSKQALEMVANALVHLGRAQEAVERAKQLVDLGDGENPRVVLARTLIAAGSTGDGCRELQRALNFNSANSRLQLELASCHLQNDDPVAAALHASAVIQRDPSNAMARVVLEQAQTNQRTAWAWVPMLAFLVGLFAAVGARRPEQWGKRHVAWGVMAFAGATFVWLVAGDLFWLAGGFWGIYQFYAAHRFRRTRISRIGTRSEYLDTAARILGYVALSDGELQPAELRLIRETYEQAGFSEQDLMLLGQTLRQCVSEFESKLFDHQALYVALREACVKFCSLSNEPTRLELFRTAVRVALCDQHASPGELNAIRACGTWLNVSQDDQNQIWREHS